MQELDRTVVLRVLIAEDEQFQRSTLEALFKTANSSLHGSVYYDAHLVSSASEVLETLRRDIDWQLVILDIFMPDRCGDEIIGEVRSVLGEKVPLLMISAVSEMGAVQRCLRVGADLCVAKPLHLNAIRNLWQHCMLKHPALFDDAGALPAAAEVPSSPHEGVAAARGEATVSAPIASHVGAASDTSRAAELVAQLERLNMPSESKVLDEEDEEDEDGACRQQ